MDERPHLIVIGNGMTAGRAVDERLACRPRRRRITVPGVEPSPTCKHVLSSAILGGGPCFQHPIASRNDVSAARQVLPVGSPCATPRRAAFPHPCKD